jgi:hypothetical protein
VTSLRHPLRETDSTPVVIRAFAFGCSTVTYVDCVHKGLFGSNLPWLLQIQKTSGKIKYHLL